MSVPNLDCRCGERETPLLPDTMTCGACQFSWCERCHPTHGPRCWNELNHVDETAPILPIVHLNGTSRDSLVNERVEVGQALRTALKELAQMFPNGRDYYLVPGLLEKARAQHERRRAALAGVLAEIEAEVEALVDGEERVQDMVKRDRESQS